MKPSYIDRTLVKLYNPLRKIYCLLFGENKRAEAYVINSPLEVNNNIFNLLKSDKPCMVCRFGSNELECTIFGRNRLFYRYNPLTYISKKSDIWWYPDSIVHKMFYNAGFFSPTNEQLDRFSTEMINAMNIVDILGSWRPKDESFFYRELANAKRVNLELLSPLWCGDNIPWSAALEGKKVLVVHPFVETIKYQYKRREYIHKDKRILPSFTLKTIKAIQTITGVKPDERFDNWFEALRHMEDEIDKTDYDICLLGCGAYGFLLAAHCKRMGKKAVHLGGALQLLFGIKGKRWEDPDYGFNGINYLSFMNEYWVRPSYSETPSKANTIEGSCYW